MFTENLLTSSTGNTDVDTSWSLYSAKSQEARGHCPASPGTPGWGGWPPGLTCGKGLQSPPRVTCSQHFTSESPNVEKSGKNFAVEPERPRLDSVGSILVRRPRRLSARVCVLLPAHPPVFEVHRRRLAPDQTLPVHAPPTTAFSLFRGKVLQH